MNNNILFNNSITNTQFRELINQPVSIILPHRKVKIINNTTIYEFCIANSLKILIISPVQSGTVHKIYVGADNF